MAISKANMVRETTSTSGTADYELAGATGRYQTFLAGVGDGAVVRYSVFDGSDFEVGRGTLTAGTPDVLSRDAVEESSNSDAKVDWPASGTREVHLVPTAGTNVEEDENGDVSVTRDISAGRDLTVAGQGTYNPSTAVPPLILNANAQGQKVIGLNADQLDGRDDYWHPDNDGAGSGLDADLVQGQDVNGNTIWHSGNDGAGSGLDADLLDGSDASSYQLVRHDSLFVSSATASVSFTDIPVNAKKATVVATGVSLDGSGDLLVQVGDGSLATSGYSASSAHVTGSGTSVSNSSAGFIVRIADSAAAASFTMDVYFMNATNDTFVSSHTGRKGSGTLVHGGGDMLQAAGGIQKVTIASTAGNIDAGDFTLFYQE